ncbi:hypothetical protein [Calderihabitans maritimus]|uniref:Uncharacterized protein n=3 Tax=Calderihabitans maritimus TaxID=1246530 RepID=A0A1Z5HRU0_9FIRM|nr:hypothetical protein [Calderihabitans maritimus]GAW92041.1 hypothetical protein KKC1_12010 [Calderihabitans maritimus]
MKTWLIKELNEGNLDFRKLEWMLFNLLIGVFRHLMAEILEAIDLF